MTNSVFDQQPEFDVVALGELLVDFTQNGKSDQGKRPGQSPL